jgi:hypothetical protein
MHLTKIPTGKTFCSEDKTAAFELWKVKLPIEDRRN